jgi:transglutaminase-like putative cysteine protease
MTCRPRAIHGTLVPTETLAQGSGTCRDFALLMIEAVRSLGMAARFVTGYLYDASDRCRRADGPGRLGRDPCLGPGLPAGRAGWVEFDPTNGLVGGAHLIRVAVARDPRQAMPLPGSYHGYASDFIEMLVDVRVPPARAPDPAVCRPPRFALSSPYGYAR